MIWPPTGNPCKIPRIHLFMHRYQGGLERPPLIGMKFKIYLGITLSLVAASIFVAIRSTWACNDQASETGQPESEGKRAISNRSQLDQKAGSFRFLESVPGLDINSPPTFASIEARAAHLDIAQIETLLNQHTSHEGLSGWLRSALWAELGRRNHRPSIDTFLTKLEISEKQKTNFAHDQAIFAILRGRIETISSLENDLSPVIEDMNSFTSAREVGYWRSRSVTHLFAKMTQIDHSAAWDFVHNNPLNAAIHNQMPGVYDNKHVAPLAGFFRSLPSEILASTYLQKWQPALEAKEATAAYDNYRKQLESTLSGIILTPPGEAIISHALASLARFNPEAAVDWLNQHEPNPDKPDYNRPHAMWRQLATHHPAQALEIFSREEFINPRRGNIGWLIQNDYTLLPNAVTETEKFSHQTQIIQSVLMSAASTHVNDFFPTPGGPNRLPDFQKRHDSLLEAIKRGTYHEKQKESLLRSLKREFAGKVGVQ